MGKGVIGKRFWLGFFLLCFVAILGGSIWFYLTKLNHRYRFEKAALSACQTFKDSKQSECWAFSTMDDYILSREILDIFRSTEQKMSKELGRHPKMIYWEDVFSYPGLILLWEGKQGHVRLDVFSSMECDSIGVEVVSGPFTTPSTLRVPICREGRWEDLERIIRSDRVTKRMGPERAAIRDWVYAHITEPLRLDELLGSE